MDKIALVESLIEDGQTLLDRLSHENFPVAAAFWVKSFHVDYWSLYIASPRAEDREISGGYSVILRVLNTLVNSSITSSYITLISDKHPGAKVILDILRRHPGRVPKLLTPPSLPGISVEDVYLYPQPIQRAIEPLEWQTVRLKTAVEQKLPLSEAMISFTPQEKTTLEQIVCSGTAPAQAEYFVFKRREAELRKMPIPAGTIVRSRIAGHWGINPGDDPNPLLLVKTEEGAEGLTFKENTEAQ